MFDEIAADYSHIFVRFSERVLQAAVDAHLRRRGSGAFRKRIAAIAAGNELVYVPCHRSTMDDLLVPYAVYTRGFAVPHIAAGINLNLPVVGPHAAQGRRLLHAPQFPRQSAVYGGVHELPGRHHGARSSHPVLHRRRPQPHRPLAAPKTGMLSMTLRSYIRQPVRPVMFVPVYLGYERIMEVDSYVGELSGRPKEKETLWGFLRSLKRLRENFGHVHVNIGEPIALSPLLDEHQPDWRELGPGGPRRYGRPAVDVLARRIMRNINAAAAVTPVNLLALVLLATPRQVMLETDLRRQLALCLTLLRPAPYS